MAFSEGERPSERRSSRSSVALPPLSSTGGSSREGERPVERGVRGTRPGKPCISELFSPEAIELGEDVEGPKLIGS